MVGHCGLFGLAVRLPVAMENVSGQGHAPIQFRPKAVWTVAIITPRVLLAVCHIVQVKFILK